ncbi:MAG: hypothetical protein PHP04_09585 [Bacteroidales bacterium]|nr:hypothetical protein [Bacteroidales bacterium]
MPVFKTNLDIQQNQLLNAVLHRLRDLPSNPVAGQIYFNEGEGLAYLFDGQSWIPWGFYSGGGEGGIKKFTMNITNPIVGTSFLMVRLFEELIAMRVDAHFNSDTNVFFNIDCRMEVNEPGINLNTLNMKASYNGNEYSAIDSPSLYKDHWLCLTIASDEGEIPPESDPVESPNGIIFTGEEEIPAVVEGEGELSGVLTVVLTCGVEKQKLY